MNAEKPPSSLAESRAESLADSLAEALAERARTCPAAPALYADGEVRSYGQLAEHSAQYAAGLAALDLPQEAILALFARSEALVLATLACSWLGLPFMPLSPDTLPARWQHLRSLAPKRIYRLDHLPTGNTTVPPARVSATAPALAIATSGSEGLPKAVLLSHAALMAAARGSAALIPLQAGDVWLNCLPLQHIGGQSILWRCFTAGAAIRLHDGFDAVAVWNDIANGHVSHVSLVPAMLARLLDMAERTHSRPPATLRCALIGGAALSRPLWQRANAAGWPLFISYGMTETAAQVATLPPVDHWHEGLVGKPLPGVDISIDDEGRVLVRAPQLMLGYLDNDGAGQPPIADNSLRTGDLGRIDAQGCLTILGRADDVLVSAGINIHPQEIEGQLAACPGIQDVAVTATTDPVWGDVLAALLVGSVEPETVRDWSNAHLPSSLRPRRFLLVEALPRNAMGKLKRRALPAFFTDE
jgi:O-succinylbenzoic acid--CoA ligase